MSEHAKSFVEDFLSEGEPAKAAFAGATASSAKLLLKDWETKVINATEWRNRAWTAGDVEYCARYNQQIDAYNYCITGLRRQMEASNVRQPEENIGSETRRQETENTHD